MNPTCKKRLGAIRLETMKVVAQEEIAPAIFELVLEGEMVEAMRAGQFLHLRVPDDAHLLRRPISISSIDKVKKQCHLIYRIEGAGTAIFSTLSQGYTLDVMGPQGNGFDLSDLNEQSQVLLVGGGIGVPPLLEVAKELHARGVKFDAVYSCGAPGMMKYINQTFYDHPRAYLSLESRMACGMGACYACVLKVPESETVSQRVCEDGPVFRTGTVVL